MTLPMVYAHATFTFPLPPTALPGSSPGRPRIGAGPQPTLWPGSTTGFCRATRRLDPAEYEVIPQRQGTGR